LLSQKYTSWHFEQINDALGELQQPHSLPRRTGTAALEEEDADMMDVEVAMSALLRSSISRLLMPLLFCCCFFLLLLPPCVGDEADAVKKMAKKTKTTKHKRDSFLCRQIILVDVFIALWHVPLLAIF